MKKIGRLFIISFSFLNTAFTQDATALVNKVKAKLDLVSDYSAEGTMKTNIVFIKAPISKVKVYYRKPNQFRLKRDGGISVLPKGGVNVNMSTVVSLQDYMAISAGEVTINGVLTKVVKLLPLNENDDIVLSTLYIDDKSLLIRKVITSTKESGTYEMELSYGKFSNYGLPDKVVFSFNTKDYKLPKGLTLEFEDGQKTNDLKKLKDKKGKVEVVYRNYQINKGLPVDIFKP